MNSLKPILAAILLTLTISISALAGDVGTPTYKDPPPPASCSYCDETTSDQIQAESTDATLSTEPKSLETSEFAVDLLLALLSFF